MTALAEVMHRASELMMQELTDIRKSFKHPGIKGDGSEEILRRFLKKYLPKGLEVGTGEIIDHTGQRSKQCDVVIYNPLRAPTFAQSDSHQVFPAEGVVAVIEVKTRLAKSRIESIVEAMKTVKSLDRSGYLSPWKNSDSLNLSFNWYGKNYDYPPILFFVFSFESDDLYKIGHTFQLHQMGQPIDERVDSVYCLDKGALIWLTPGKGSSSALPDLSRYWSLVPTEHTLLLFYILSFEYLAPTTDMIRFNVLYYAPQTVDTGDVAHLTFKGCSSPEEVWQVLLSGDMTKLIHQNPESIIEASRDADAE